MIKSLNIFWELTIWDMSENVIKTSLKIPSWVSLKEDTVKKITEDRLEKNRKEELYPKFDQKL